MDLCASRPCQNGGRCFHYSDGEESESYRCQCPAGFEGEDCQVSGQSIEAEEEKRSDEGKSWSDIWQLGERAIAGRESPSFSFAG